MSDGDGSFPALESRGLLRIGLLLRAIRETGRAIGGRGVAVTATEERGFEALMDGCTGHLTEVSTIGPNSVFLSRPVA